MSFRVVSIGLVAGLFAVIAAGPGASPPNCVPTEPTAPVCAEDGDCTTCTYGSAPSSTGDCYCPMCPYAVMTAEECRGNAEAWTRHCSRDVWPDGPMCPIPSCILPPPVYCDETGTCQARARECLVDADCTVCTYGSAPASTDDCFCPMCPYAVMSGARCEDNAAAWQEHCSWDVWPDGPMCPIPMCVQPPEVVCDFNGQCVAEPY